MQKAKGRIKNLVIGAVAFLPALCFGQNLDSLRIDLFKSRYGAGNEYKAGSEKAIALIDDFRTWAKVNNFSGVNPWEWNETLAQCKDESGVTWRVFIWKKYGVRSLWITSSVNEVNWSEPILINPPKLVDFSKGFIIEYNKKKQRCGIMGGDSTPFYCLPDIKCRIKTNKSVFIISFDKQKISFSISELLQSFDNDGLPDDVETLLTTNPRSIDTDSDGIVDKTDGNPLVAPVKNIDTVEIKQAVFYNEVANSNSKRAIVAFENNEGDFQEYYGYGGYVLGSNTYKKGFASFSLHDLIINGDTAQITISTYRDYRGDFKEIKLQKIMGKWYVVGYGKCYGVVS